VAEAAERALVSRATAYRYFPTQESLLLDVANVEALLKPVEDLVDDDEEIVATLEWAASALLRTALHDFEQPE
jgi:AcrR family transcriptional regulator